MANISILAAFERMWQHITTALNNKSDISHNHNDIYDAVGSADAALTSAKSYSNTNLASAKSYSDANLVSAKTYTDNAITQKTQVQIITWGDDD